MIEYVKPLTKKTSIPERIPKTPYKLTSAMKTEILKLKPINEETVKQRTQTSRKQARQILSEMHEAGEIKTYDERYAELYPPKEITP